MIGSDPANPADEDLWSDFERAFRSLLWRGRPRRLQLRVEIDLETARRRVGRGELLTDALKGLYRRARAQLLRKLIRRRAAAQPSSADCVEQQSPRRMRQVTELLHKGIPVAPVPADPDFHCDAALGGLARWLRGIGYKAAWWPGIDDGHLLDKVYGSTAILLTTDRPLMERGLIRWGAVPAVLIPHNLKKREQLAFLVAQLGLPRKRPLCMSCGGVLRPVEKESVRDRIPPRTYPWRDEYYLCAKCDKLFWEGTHWQEIERVLLENATRTDTAPSAGRLNGSRTRGRPSGTQ